MNWCMYEKKFGAMYNLIPFLINFPRLNIHKLIKCHENRIVTHIWIGLFVCFLEQNIAKAGVPNKGHVLPKYFWWNKDLINIDSIEWYFWGSYRPLLIIETTYSHSIQAKIWLRTQCLCLLVSRYTYYRVRHPNWIHQ